MYSEKANGIYWGMLVGEHGATLRANRVGTTTVDVGSLVQLWSYKIRLAWHRMNR